VYYSSAAIKTSTISTRPNMLSLQPAAVEFSFLNEKNIIVSYYHNSRIWYNQCMYSHMRKIRHNFSCKKIYETSITDTQIFFKYMPFIHICVPSPCEKGCGVYYEPVFCLCGSPFFRYLMLNNCFIYTI
jgi:hypothetical protein